MNNRFLKKSSKKREIKFKKSSKLFRFTFFSFILISFSILSILSISKNVSASQTLYQGYIFSGDSLTVNQRSLQAYINNNHNQIWVQYDDVDEYVKIENCKIIKNIRFCFDSVTFDFDKEEYKADITITTYLPIISFTRTINSNTGKVGDEFEITVTIHNTGEKRADDVYYQDIIPSEFEIVNYDPDLTINSNKLTFLDNLNSDDSTDFSYTIKPKTEISKSLTAKITYDNTIETKTI
ncbi:MAG: CARDB domain-containing protein, partial [bacterium]